MRLVKTLPRDLDSDLIHGAGLSASDYTTLMHLSEASSVRSNFFDHMDPAVVSVVASAISGVANHVEDR